MPDRRGRGEESGRTRSDGSCFSYRTEAPQWSQDGLPVLAQPGGSGLQRDRRPASTPAGGSFRSCKLLGWLHQSEHGRAWGFASSRRWSARAPRSPARLEGIRAGAWALEAGRSKGAEPPTWRLPRGVPAPLFCAVSC